MALFRTTLRRMQALAGREDRNRLILVKAVAVSGFGRRLRTNRGPYSVALHNRALSIAIFLDPIARTAEESVVRELVSSGGCVVDVGANVGTITLCAAKAVGPSGRVWAFEPNPRSFAALLDNLKINNVDNVLALQLAVGDRDEPVAMTDERGDDQNRVEPAGDIEVSARRLDEILPPDIQIELLKIDVEGFEFAVLKGARRALRSTMVVQFEFDENHLASFGTQPKDLLEFLDSEGFDVKVRCGREFVPFLFEAGQGRLNLYAFSRKNATSA